jgi:hypothetical protein
MEDHRNDELSEEELLALEISEDRRLNRLGIGPDGDPVDIMLEVRRQAQELHEQQKSPERKRDE